MTRILTTVSDVTPDVEQVIEDCLDWFEGEPLHTEAFIDRLCDSYGGDDWDIENYDCPAARAIMQQARLLRRTS